MATVSFVDHSGDFVEPIMTTMDNDSIVEYTDPDSFLSGYLVNVAFEEGFTPYVFNGKTFYFDVTSWKIYQHAVDEAKAEYNDSRLNWLADIVKNPDAKEPVYKEPTRPKFWKNRHSEQEIKEFTKSIVVKTPEQKIADLELANIRNQKLIASMYEAIMYLKGM